MRRFRCFVLALLSCSAVAAQPELPTAGDIDHILRSTSVEELYVVCSSHWDLGFTAPTDTVQERVKHHLDEVVENCRAEPRLRWTVESVWQILEWLKRTPDEVRRRQFFDLVRQGQIGVSAAFGGMLSGLMGTEELCRYLQDGQQLAVRYRVPVEAALMDDVPGYSWALPQVFALGGVKFFLTGVNTRFGGKLDLPLTDRPFWWRGRNGSRVLTWICQGYNESARTYHLPPTEARFFAEAFGKPHLKGIKDLDRIQDLGMAEGLRRLNEAGYRLPILLTMHSMDFISSDRALEILKWADRWNDRHEKPKIHLTTPATFYRRLMALDTEFAEHGGNFSGLWETGQSAAPNFQARVHRLRERLPALEAVCACADQTGILPYPLLPIQSCWTALLQCHEHGMGLGVGWPKLMTTAEVRHQNAFATALAADAAEAQDHWMRTAVSALGEKARIDAPAVFVFNPLVWPRAAAVAVDLPVDMAVKPFDLLDDETGESIPYELRESRLSFVARLPAAGYRRYRLALGQQPAGTGSSFTATSSELSNASLRVTIDRERGIVESVTSLPSGRQLLAAPGAFARLVRRSHREDFLGADTLVAVDEDESEVVASAGRCSASLTIRHRESPLAQLQLAVHGDLDWLELTAQVDARRTRHVPRAEHSDHYYLRFLFAASLTNYRLDSPAGMLTPATDFLPGAVRERAIVQRLITLTDQQGGVAVSPREAEICLFSPRAGRGGRFEPKPGELLWKVFSDAEEGVTRDLGTVRFSSIEPGPVKTYHYAVRAISGKPDLSALQRWGAEQSNPPITCYLPPAIKPLFRPKPKPWAPVRSFITVEPSHVELLAFYPLSSQVSGWWLLRLHETAGQSANVIINLPGTTLSASLCDLSGRPTSSVALPVSPLRLALKPWDIVTVRVRIQDR